MAEKAELRPAFCWTCPECGSLNHGQPHVPELTAEDLSILQDMHGISANQAGAYLAYPDEVSCARCGSDFETLHYNEEEDES